MLTKNALNVFTLALPIIYIAILQMDLHTKLILRLSMISVFSSFAEKCNSLKMYNVRW